MSYIPYFGTIWRCFDCGQFGGDYMVSDEVWLEAVPNYVKDRNKPFVLCLECLENRLQRELTASDFPRIPVNTAILRVFKIQERSKQRERINDE